MRRAASKRRQRRRQAADGDGKPPLATRHAYLLLAVQSRPPHSAQTPLSTARGGKSRPCCCSAARGAPLLVCDAGSCRCGWRAVRRPVQQSCAARLRLRLPSGLLCIAAPTVACDRHNSALATGHGAPQLPLGSDRAQRRRPAMGTGCCARARTSAATTKTQS